VKGFPPPRHGGAQVGLKALELSADAVPIESLDLEQVYRAHADTVMRWATRLLGRSADAGDVTQEVFFVVQRKLPSFKPVAATLETWLFRITENVVRGFRRRERVRRIFFGERELPEVADDRPDAAAQLVAGEQVKTVYRVLDSLRETDRTLLVLFEIEGYSGATVAELMGLDAATIWVKLHRARQRFAERLEGLGGER